MNGTPRLRSAFPDTPPPSRRRNPAVPRYGASSGSPSSAPKPNDSPLPQAPSPQPAPESPPLIPFETIDAANQRFYVASFYIALWGWRLYDFYNLVVDDTESLWLFMKWITIDGTFLFGLPALRIPWLEWSSTTMAVLFMIHSTLDGMLMFKIGVPITSWFIGLTKLIYNYETAISERRVKPDALIHNASLILGRQVIHILPEGSAMLNPFGESFCLDGTRHQVDLAIQINQTNPIGIEILRVDLETQDEEIITIKQSEAKRMRKAALKERKNGDNNGPLILRYPVKKTGYYVLQKVMDESKLEVQPRRSRAIVALCPTARIKPNARDRCHNELSDITIGVTGTPPLKLIYRKTAHGKPQRVSLDSLQLDESAKDGVLTKTGATDVSSFLAQTIDVSLNETLQDVGLWSCEIEEVQDALGNVVSYASLYDDDERSKIQALGLKQELSVHDRPVALISKNVQGSLRAQKGQSKPFPIEFDTQETEELALEYFFTPEQEIAPDGRQSELAQFQRAVFKNTGQSIPVREPGLYSLHSVSSKFCSGTIIEPSSFILQNSPEPDLSIETEDITDSCANRPIGKKVFLDLVGTPPFSVVYKMYCEGEKQAEVIRETFEGYKGVLTLQPREAGTYHWNFIQVADSVYPGHSLESKNLHVQQDVKPPPYAIFFDNARVTPGCIDEAVEFRIVFQGEGPWHLEYELVRAGKRSKHEVDLEQKLATITTEPLTVGGEYTLVLVSVTDSSGCTELLEDEALIAVRHQRPQASFGQLDGKHSVRALQGRNVQLPLRLTGRGPWDVRYRAPGKESEQAKSVRAANGFLEVSDPGEYKLVSVKDLSCAGTIDETAHSFHVSWLDRPTLHITESDLVKKIGDYSYAKEPVCEGDEDSLDISFSGAPPYKIAYEEHRRPISGQKSMRRRDLSGAIGLASIRMETSQAGMYEYKFTELSDYNYDYDPKQHNALSVSQHVYARPVAKFAHPGMTYSYCATDRQDSSDLAETIPIKLVGMPPFSLEVELKHHSAGKPEAISIPNIPGNTYDIRLPHRHLHLGSSTLTVRKVRDSRGCQSLPSPVPVSSRDKNQQERVLIAVHSAPSITPLESQSHYCVGDRLSFSLGGQPPFNVYYDFVGARSEQRKASSQGATFRRLAEKPGVFTITAVSDSASSCRASVADPMAAGLQKTIHPLPAVRMSKGRESRVDIHEGGEAEILFEFEGTPPFEFTWTRSELDDRRSGKKGAVLETRTATSEDYSLRINASEEGSYEVVAVRDRWCGVSKSGSGRVGRGDKLLTN